MSNKRTQAKLLKSVKEKLLKWLCIKYANNTPVDRYDVKKEAMELLEFFEVKTFKCTESWITHFLKRYGFCRELTDCRGPVLDDYRFWIHLVRPELESYEVQNQFHVDELMMFTDFIPVNSNASQNDIEVVNNIAENTTKISPMHKVSLLLATNISGTEKLLPMICGPYLVPERDDCFYSLENNGHISNALFAGWLSTLNRDMEKQNRSIILFISRRRINIVQYVTPSHIKLMFIPKECPPDMKPFRTDVFHYLKMKYRSQYIENLFQFPEIAYWDPAEIIKVLVEAWKEISETFLVANFQRTKYRVDDQNVTVDCPYWNKMMAEEPFKKFVTFDDNMIDSPNDDLINNYQFSTTVLKLSLDAAQNNIANINPGNDDDLVNNNNNDEGPPAELNESLDTSDDDDDDMDVVYEAQNCEVQNENQDALVPQEDQNEFHADQDEDTLLEPALVIDLESDSVLPIEDAPIPTCADADAETVKLDHSPERVEFTNGTTGSVDDDLHEPENSENASPPVENSPRRNLNRAFNGSPIPSTSTANPDESYYFPQFHESFSPVSFHHVLEMQDVSDSDFEIEDVNRMGDPITCKCNSFEREYKEDMDLNNNDESNETPNSNNWAERYETQLAFGPDVVDFDEQSTEDDESCDMIVEAQDIKAKRKLTFNLNSPSPKSH